MATAPPFVLSPGSSGNDTVAIQQAVDSCSANGGGKVILQAGRYHSGTIHLRSGVALHLEKDAVLLASPSIKDYWHKEGMPTALLFADGAEEIGLSGEGTVDGNARTNRKKSEALPDWVKIKLEQPFHTWIPAFETVQGPRPLALVHFADCRKVRLEGLRIEDSPRWTLHLAGCTDIILRHLTIRSPANASNGDGIDLDGCSDALVEDCDIETGDDAICLKSSRTWGLERPCRNITIRRCRAFSTTHGFCIGHDTQDDFENITVTDLQIGGHGEHRNLTGIGIGTVDGAVIRNVKLSNIQMQDVVAPFQIRLSNEGKHFRGHTPATGYHQKKMGHHPPGKISDIVLENVTVRNAIGNSFLSGLPGHALQQISFRNVEVQFTGQVDPARVLTTVPELVTEYPGNEMWCYLPAYGFFCRHVAGLELSNVTVKSNGTEKRPALLLEDVVATPGPLSVHELRHA